MDLVYVHLTHLLRPRVYEMRYYHAMQLLTEYEATSHGAGARPARGGGTLPMHDTVKRVLYSLPTAFADLVRVLVEAQEEAGEGRYVSMFLLVEHMEKKGIMISQGRLKALQRELTSNRLAVYDPAEHALCIPQHTKLRRILQEVAEERSTGLPGNLQQV
ncbi:hypothetical protein AGDE_05692 [Angomonas deanei]|uniref:Uncharacterized protein n=1 Tax=Angomonas deanei TaxID=59799 RepID=A0A7G2CNZ8_9TRYP|nr:hypothetical protein AGDE_05692 [Angomonas deanei]CAD2221215.1 hypothetical protein, conserved [Angomonas deanei]|eukprot:EPY38239.1 hypothetical protein AGDE_05692 [Angomonas deanei]